MIVGRKDTWFTVPEFAAMIDRSEKTVHNWASEGTIQFAHLCGVPLVSMAMIETLITGHVPDGARDGDLALELMNRMAPDRTRVPPEKRNRRKPVACINKPALSVSHLPEKQP
jgi:hypothetical protein